jgi:hypothetical protein
MLLDLWEPGFPNVFDQPVSFETPGESSGKPTTNMPHKFLHLWSLTELSQGFPVCFAFDGNFLGLLNCSSNKYTNWNKRNHQSSHLLPTPIGATESDCPEIPPPTLLPCDFVEQQGCPQLLKCNSHPPDNTLVIGWGTSKHCIPNRVPINQ